VETLKDIWASMVAGVQERTTNPLTFSFIASWCLWNFKFFAILAGDGTTAERLHAVDALYPVSWSTYFGHALGAPLLTAAAYVFLYPSLSAKVIEGYRKKQVKIANAVREIEGTRVLTVEESSRMTRSIEAERAAWQEREAKLQDQLRSLRDALSAATREANEVASDKTNNPPNKTASIAETAPLKDGGVAFPKQKATAKTGAEIMGQNDQPSNDPINETEFKILTTLSDSSRAMSSGEVAVTANLNHSVTLVTLERLQAKDLVQDENLGKWELTSRGHRLAVTFFD
jgi:predicted transcriptional regulator